MFSFTFLLACQLRLLSDKSSDRESNGDYLSFKILSDGISLLITVIYVYSGFIITLIELNLTSKVT